MQYGAIQVHAKPKTNSDLGDMNLKYVFAQLKFHSRHWQIFFIRNLAQ